MHSDLVALKIAEFPDTSAKELFLKREGKPYDHSNPFAATYNDEPSNIVYVVENVCGSNCDQGLYKGAGKIAAQE